MEENLSVVYAIKVTNQEGHTFGIKENGQIELTDSAGNRKIVDGDQEVIDLAKELLRLLSDEKCAKKIIDATK